MHNNHKQVKPIEFRLARIIRDSVNWVKMVIFTGVFLGIGVLLWLFNFSLFFILAACFGVYLATGGWKFIRVAVLTAPRDLRGLYILVSTTLGSKSMLRNKTTVHDLFDATVTKNPNKVCFLFKDETWRFGEFQAYTNRVANFLREKGLGKGDVVAVFSENCPEMVAMWLAMSRLGVTAALINFNLRDVSLTHCIKVSNAKAVIFGTNLQEAVADIAPSISQDTLFFSLGKDPVTSLPVATNIDQEVEKSSDRPIPKTQIDPMDTLFYIYTSGTTGLPKAAKINHIRFFALTNAMNLFTRLRSDDILYTSLPLYHTAGVVLGVGQCLLFGTAIALRQKFSASQFWNDCIKYRATASQYIGEICRYLVAQPPKPEDCKHSVRMIYGNGLKPQIWKTFQERFQVKDIVEFYGSTEGNCSVVNNQNVVGAIGFTTRIAPALYPITIIKVDPETEKYVRDSRGICVKCKPGEQGEMVGKITSNPLRKFDGYLNEQATNKKIIRDVFSKGDMAFSTGDILVMDELGFLFFCDRTGDTFRWRGENVSTSEVEAIVSNHISYNDAVVYGVEVPGCEGRAGMVAMVAPDASSEDVRSMGENWCRALPAYARPVFVRILPQTDTTGTFKFKKTKLKDEGFNLEKVDDPLYFLDPSTRSYRPLDQETYNNILSGSLRL